MHSGFFLKKGAGLLAKAGEALQTPTPGEGGVGALDENGFPSTLEGYERLQRKNIVPIIKELSALEFGIAPRTVHIRSLGEAVASAPLYKYDATRDVIVNQQTGELYTPINGTFTSGIGRRVNARLHRLHRVWVTITISSETKVTGNRSAKFCSGIFRSRSCPYF